MAKKVSDADEREARIIEIGSYFLKTGASTREIAKYFTENRFEISNYTVSQYIKKYTEKFPQTSKSVDEKIKNKTPATIDDEDVLARVIFVSKAYLNNYTMKEIADSLGVSVDVIFDDLHTRLPKIKDVDKYFKLEGNESIVDIVSEIAEKRSINNLKN